MYKPSPCQCTIQSLLKEQENILKIIYAEKNQTDNNSFIVYTIQTKVIYLKDFFYDTTYITWYIVLGYERSQATL